MKELYRRLREQYGKDRYVLFTVIEGPNFGEKVLFLDGELCWASDEKGFLVMHQDKLKNIYTIATVTLDGQKVFCEIVGQEKKLVICGGGHVAIPLIKMGKLLKFEVTVLEDRSEFAKNAELAGADKVFCKPFAEGLEQVEGDKDTYFVIVTRGHRYDKDCLEQIIKKENAYIGMIGSKNRVQKVKEELVEKGNDRLLLDRVYSPIGINIGSETPEEIAVSILAEIISIKNDNQKNACYSKKILRDISDNSEPMVLTTIVRKSGSGPREVGTKMLVFSDGTISGTIGGGSMESKVIQKSLQLLNNNDLSSSQCSECKTPSFLQSNAKGTSFLCYFDMSGKEAEEDGMVCGGNVDVLFESL